MAKLEVLGSIHPDEAQLVGAVAEEISSDFARIVRANNAVDFGNEASAGGPGLNKMREVQEFCAQEHPDVAARAIFDSFSELRTADTNEPLSNINDFAELLEIGDRDARMVKNYVGKYVRHNNGSSMDNFRQLNAHQIRSTVGDLLGKQVELNSQEMDPSKRYAETTKAFLVTRKKLKQDRGVFEVLEELILNYESLYAHPSNT